MARLAKKKMQNHFEAMVQSTDESVHAFKNRFVDQLTRLDLVRVARPSAPDLAITFIDKLEYARHEAIRVTMRNNAALRIKALPGTFETVHEIAKVYGTVSKPITSSRPGSGAHVFMTSDELVPVKQSTNTDSSRPRGPNWERNREKRDNTQKANKAADLSVSFKPSGAEVDKYPATSREKLCSSLISKMIGLEGWPIPNILETLTRLGTLKPTCFGLLDFTAGYHQTRLHPDSRELTAFRAAGGLYQWTRVAMGLKGAGPYFQRSMQNKVLQGLVYKIFEIYIDYVHIHGKTDPDFLRSKKVSRRSNT